MSAPKLSVPNLDPITKKDVKTGEALHAIQQYINANTTPAAGNKVTPPTFVNPTRPAG